MRQDKEIPKGYKDSPLGIIPEEWEVKRLGEISEINPLKDKNIIGVVSFIAMADVSVDGRLLFQEKVNYSTIGSGFTSFQKNDILVAKITPCFENGKGALLNNLETQYGFGSTEFHVIRTSINSYFLHLHTITYSFRERLKAEMTGSAGQKRVPSDSLSSYKIPLPPLREQQKIAEILTTWDRSIEMQTALVEKLELRKRGLMQQLLTGKKRLINATSWQMMKAGSIFKNVSNKGFENERLLSATQENGVIPRDMLEARVTMPSGETKSFKLVEIGDFVISLRSFQGGIEYSYYRGIVSPAYTVLKPKQEICNEYYKQYFKSCDFISRLAVAVIGIRDGKQISYDDFCFIKIPSPSLVEQTEIANILTASDKQIYLARTKLITLRTQKSGLMQQLLTGKKRINHI